ncbi:hypothetical protein AVEN_47045-1 [Araneus ventricosus]|uniref:Peptidase aspartic putative domain-containing protein n=1 Tax=Araneus ventricosus TaxID=182803 RepID=A0A4Y2EY08_ARAVE|nr:hypothetical protein AVEN_47045-1 [Araneus ventricosus]
MLILVFVHLKCGRVSIELNLKFIGLEELKIYTFVSTEPIVEKRNKIPVILRNLSDQRDLVIEALEMPNNSISLIKIPDKDSKSYFKRNNRRLADKSDSDGLKLSVLIGKDCYWKVATGRIRRLTGALVACQSSFGWTVSGSNATLSNTITQQSANVMNVAVDRAEVNSNEEVDSILLKFWELQSILIKEENETFFSFHPNAHLCQ